MPDDKPFVSPDKYMVLIPYSDLERMANMAQEMEEMKKYCARMEEQYTAIRGMFSEVLEVVKNIQDFVKD